MGATNTATRSWARRSRAKLGRRADLRGVFFRSAWEANYARYLNLRVERGEIRAWEYEPKTFDYPVKRGNRHYTPDFLVTLANGDTEWHEVKGWMDDNSRVKLKRFAKYYPNERLVLIDKTAYRQIEAEVRESLAAWE